jgi:hypothetical protein
MVVNLKIKDRPQNVGTRSVLGSAWLSSMKGNNGGTEGIITA